MSTSTAHAPSTEALTIPTEKEWPLKDNWPPQGKWTYEDYRRLPDDGWIYEVIEGELYMSPPPIPIHQENSGNLYVAFHNYAKKHDAGKVYDAPIEVILAEWANPVQPDIVFITKERLHIVKQSCIEGAPDIIAEILSPSNWLTDRREKFTIYAKAGVREYWIVNPSTRTIERFALREDRYALMGKYGAGETVRSEVLPGFEVKVDEVCPAY
ncbi:MAG: Uma2 family endonuclease [candidate division KSB1 bacterium]|nr:Uma2 family endonuclease [candidate division KSB1 bacterium]MDZ7369299.1 Uma2 family endonuclease [candidate division KSB1 bacterium]MDZ7407344.1 Uma2 family endonuclease [candidate division KSB1 bacterium]